MFTMKSLHTAILISLVVCLAHIVLPLPALIVDVAKWVFSIGLAVLLYEAIRGNSTTPPTV